MIKWKIKVYNPLKDEELDSNVILHDKQADTYWIVAYDANHITGDQIEKILHEQLESDKYEGWEMEDRVMDALMRNTSGPLMIGEYVRCIEF